MSYFICKILGESLELEYKTIAVVDDEEDIVTLLTEILKENGYHVMGFTNPNIK